MRADQRLDLLIRAGEALFGPRWQSDLAREMEMTDRHMRLIVAEGSPVTDAHLSRVLQIVREHAKKLEGVAAALEKEIDK